MNALLALTLVAPASAQEPSHLERLAGLCRDADGAAIGAYAGRVLWMEDGQLSGQLTRDEAAEEAGALQGETVREGFAPRSLTVPKQAPEEADGALVLHTRAVLAGEAGELGEAAIACTVRAARGDRSDPGATARG